jgi:hypothetical protein
MSRRNKLAMPHANGNDAPVTAPATLETLAVSHASLDLLQGGIDDMRRQRAELAAEVRRIDEMILRQEGAVQLMTVLVQNAEEKKQVAE